jgi:hypothetical protein
LKKEYDVALSFAGENREYVDKVANILHELGIKVFYDNFEQVNLWGKNLYTYLDDIYQHKSTFCVMFISRHYKEKLWTNHERESAQARAFIENQEYILPARFDDTVIPGVRPTTGYIELTSIKPDDLAYMIAKKLNKDIDVQILINYLSSQLPDYEIKAEGTKLIFKCDIEDYYGEFPIRLMLEMAKASDENTNWIDYMFLRPSIVPH